MRADRSLSGDPGFLDQTSDLAEHLCLVVDGEVSRWQVTEAERFLRHALGPDGAQRQLFCVLTRGAERDRLPGFLRNLRHLESGPGVARELHGLITGAAPPGADPERDTLRTAATALRGVPSELPYPSRTALVQQTVHGMGSALDDGDLALLRDLSVDLEALSKAHANGTGQAAPADLRAAVDALLDRIDRRIHAYTD
ncbi:hypothetical protein ACFQV2_14040 [Actinokineospora soli]|uniref:Uncharacterized protein n=1 Tax=Actinokineospora soli TaxID=1048753 RepID=A0ABW2TMU4_9PSEU